METSTFFSDIYALITDLAATNYGKLVKNDYGYQFRVQFSTEYTDDEKALVAKQLAGSILIMDNEKCTYVLPGTGRTFHVDRDRALTMLSSVDLNKTKISNANIGTKVMFHRSQSGLVVYTNSKDSDTTWQHTNITELVRNSLNPFLETIPEGFTFEAFVYNPFFSNGRIIGTLINIYSSTFEKLSKNEILRMPVEFFNVLEYEESLNLVSVDQVSSYLDSLPVTIPGLVFRLPGKFKDQTYYLPNLKYVEEIDPFIQSNNLFYMCCYMLKNKISVPLEFPKLLELHNLVSSILNVCVDFIQASFNKRYAKFIRVRGKQYMPIKYVLHYEMQTPNTQIWREHIQDRVRYYIVSKDEVLERILRYDVYAIANLLMYALDQSTNVFEVQEYTEDNLKKMIITGPSGEGGLEKFTFKADVPREKTQFPYLSRNEVIKELGWLRTNAEKAMTDVRNSITNSSLNYVFEFMLRPNPNSKLRYHKKKVVS